MSDPDAYCVHCGQQCACRGFRNELEQLKMANKRLTLALEHSLKVQEFQMHQDGKVKDCPLCEAFAALMSRVAK